MEIGLTRGRVFWSGGEKPTCTLPILINGIERLALIDSGCSQSVNRQQLVLTGQEEPHAQVLIACVHGDQRYYPVATLRMDWKGEDENMRVGVLTRLGEAVILGTDYEDFPSLLTKASQELVLRSWWEEVPVGIGEEEKRQPIEILSRKKKREQQKHYSQNRPAPLVDTPEVASRMCTIPGEFRQNQRDDPSLKHA
ncbi:hypothetical protein NDU88_006427 [Pleurodeles waltl]|uniref:Uncharacterized protein n=1 Tax=Pleurodeles waltl TaxID=8319 RepID=A0AAV7RNZ2_PLEWA|nr:hypothetical protein NDU88_006427 [Pleurodeles waltl]